MGKDPNDLRKASKDSRKKPQKSRSGGSSRSISKLPNPSPIVKIFGVYLGFLLECFAAN